jgi:hypothetical protein
MLPPGRPAASGARDRFKESGLIRKSLSQVETSDRLAPAAAAATQAKDEREDPGCSWTACTKAGLGGRRRIPWLPREPVSHRAVRQPGSNRTVQALAGLWGIAAT